MVARCKAIGFNMFSFQPAAHIGDERRWKEDYRSLEPDKVWELIEAGAGARLPFRVFQVGDERCNRTAWGFFLGDRWYSLLDDEDPKDLGCVMPTSPTWVGCTSTRRGTCSSYAWLAWPLLIPSSCRWRSAGSVGPSGEWEGHERCCGNGSFP
ncbi:MAG: hypothetical protein ACLQNG_02280 [Acidimicrobiales bacterium]